MTLPVDQRVVFKVLSDTNRYRILQMLITQTRLGVSDIALVLGVSVSLASQHLKILEQASVLEKEKLKQRVYYKLRRDNKTAQSIIQDVIK